MVPLLLQSHGMWGVRAPNMLGTPMPRTFQTLTSELKACVAPAFGEWWPG